jgi:hypothetical protein
VGSQSGGSYRVITHPETQASDPLPTEAASTTMHMMNRQDPSAAAPMRRSACYESEALAGAANTGQGLPNDPQAERGGVSPGAFWEESQDRPLPGHVTNMPI